MLKLAGAIAGCAAVAFVSAFFAAGAGKTTTTFAQTHPKPAAFADPAASALAGGFSGHPAALRLPPPPPVRHRASPPVVTTSTVVTVISTPAPTPTTAASSPTYSSPPAYTPPPAHKHHKSGTGTGTTTVGP